MLDCIDHGLKKWSRYCEINNEKRFAKGFVTIDFTKQISDWQPNRICRMIILY